MGLERDWAGNGPQNPEHHDAVEMDAEAKEAARRALDRAYNEGMANAQRTMHGAHGGATGIGKAGYNTWSALRDKDANLSSGEHFRSEAKAASTLIQRSFTAQELSGDTPKERYEYSGYGSQSKNDSDDYIIFGPYKGDRRAYENTSSFRKADPSPDGYRRVFAVYTHPFYRQDVDPKDRVKYSTMEGSPRVYLATPQPPGAHLSPPNVIVWPGP